MYSVLVSGCYVYTEYIGNVPAEQREAVIQQLNKETQRLIEVRW